jgi:hypothetical protein
MYEMRDLVPTTFNERASDTLLPTNIALSTPKMYTYNNPKWQQLPINEADRLGADIAMPRMNQDEIFNPQTEDVYLIEKEVEYFRNTKLKNDAELEHLEGQKKQLIREMSMMDADEYNRRLRELNDRLRLRQQEIDEYERRKREIDEENLRLENLLRQPDEALKTVAPVKVMSIAPPPEPVRFIQPAPVQVVKQQRRAGINILPSKVDYLPPQVLTNAAYNSGFSVNQVTAPQPVSFTPYATNPSTVLSSTPYQSRPLQSTVPQLRASEKTYVVNGTAYTDATLPNNISS